MDRERRCINCLKARRVKSSWSGEYYNQIKTVVSENGEDFLLRDCLNDNEIGIVDDIADLDSLCETNRFESLSVLA